jgi:NAD(P)-dependent dehydrogenase (short-subunit alcohol dehydrogenase family)
MSGALVQHSVKPPSFPDGGALVLDGAVKTTPLGRIGDAQDIAEAVIYFASRRAKFVTGQLLNVDEGWSI